MKNKKILIISLIIVIILLSIQLVLSKNKIINISKKTIKEMSSTTQETELNNQINSLNTEHTEYMNYIQTCKNQIAAAITNEGVETSEEATFETMAENISNVLQARTKDATATADNITEGKTAYVNGQLITGTGVDNNSYYQQGSESVTIDPITIEAEVQGTGSNGGTKIVLRVKNSAGNNISWQSTYNNNSNNKLTYTYPQ